MAGEVFLAQLLTAAVAISDYHRATQNLAEAQAVHVNVVQRLQAITLPSGHQPDPATLSPADREVLDARRLPVTPSRPPTEPAPSIIPSELTTGPQPTTRNRKDDRHAGR